MFQILLSAVNVGLAFLARSIIAKFFVFFALYFVVHEFVVVIAGLMPTAGALSASLSAIPMGVWYFLDLMEFSAGFPALMSAMGLRFIIRRLPVIG